MRGNGAVDDFAASGLVVGNGLNPPLPHGFAVASIPPGSAGLWHDIVPLNGDRTGVSAGSRDDAEHAGQPRAEMLAALRGTGDPLRVFDGWTAGEPSTFCMVVDHVGSRIACSCVGDVAMVIADGDREESVLDPGRVTAAVLHPGATVVAVVGEHVPDCPVVPEDCAAMRPEEVSEYVIAGLPSGQDQAVAVVVYRQPPDPLSLTVQADPKNLAVVRARLRRWLAAAAVDPKTSADALLAVGEAISNSTEHAVLAAQGPVEVTVEASIAATRLRFAVFDNGRWRPPPDSPGYRGHGIRLIRALVDTAELITSDEGTTVEMLKELRV